MTITLTGLDFFDTVLNRLKGILQYFFNEIS